MFIIFYLKMTIMGVINNFKLRKFQYDWRKKNSHNNTFPLTIFNSDSVNCGKNTYGKLNIVSYGSPEEGLTVGHYCSISDNVVFLLGGEHHPEYISNFPFYINIVGSDKLYKDNTTKGRILVGDDVWIGRDVLILSGVTIGQGAVIAAGSVVTKDVPPYAVYTTNKIIKYRFTTDVIEKLKLIDFSVINKSNFFEYKELFYSEIDMNLLNCEKFKNLVKVEVQCEERCP